MAVTVKDIANACGVSIGTVDRAMNNRGGISDDTKEKIFQVAKEMNYQRNHLARSLVLGKTMTIGVVLFDLHNRFFAEITNAIEKKAQEYGYQVNLMLTNKDTELEKNSVRSLTERKVDGIIIFSVNKGDDYLNYLMSTNTPLVTIGNRLSDKLPHIWINDYQAMKDATEHIVAMGYRKIIYICPMLTNENKVNIYTLEERYLGYMDGLSSMEIQQDGFCVIKEKDYLKSLKQMNLKQSGEKTAILCSCDYFALEVLQFLKEENFNVPGDIGVMGFDNLDILKYISPKLSTVHYPIEAIGISAVECLQKQIEGLNNSKDIIYEHRIIEGESI